MLECAICGKGVEHGAVAHRECLITNQDLLFEADENAGLAMEAGFERAKLQKAYDSLKQQLDIAITENLRLRAVIKIIDEGGDK